MYFSELTVMHLEEEMRLASITASGVSQMTQVVSSEMTCQLRRLVGTAQRDREVLQRICCFC